MAIREQQIKDMKTIKEVIDQLERELKPQYMNDVFTWKQIVDAVIKVLISS